MYKVTKKVLRDNDDLTKESDEGFVCGIYSSIAQVEDKFRARNNAVMVRIIDIPNEAYILAKPEIAHCMGVEVNPTLLTARGLYIQYVEANKP